MDYIMIFIALLVCILALYWLYQLSSGWAQREYFGGGILTLNVQEPWLDLIRIGVKKVEGRSGSATKFVSWIGQTVRFKSTKQIVLVRIIAVRHYDTLYDYLDGEGWSLVAPHLKSRTETINAYHEFYDDTKITAVGGMNAIQVELV